MTNASRTRLENIALNNKKYNSKKWRHIVDELSARKITLADVGDPESPKLKGLAQMMGDPNYPITMGDLVILSQYHEAIVNNSTRAAEFLRDTKGEKPTQDISVTEHPPLTLCSKEDLVLLLELAKSESEKTIGQDNMEDTVQGNKG